MKQIALLLLALLALALPASAQRPSVMLDVQVKPLPSLGISYDARFRPNSPWGYRVGLGFAHGSTTKADLPRVAALVPAFRPADHFDAPLSYRSSMTGSYVPLEVNFLPGRGPLRFECALGITAGLFGSNEQAEVQLPEGLQSKEEKRTLGSFSVYSNLGLRYQTDRGLMFRLGVTPEIMPTETRRAPSSSMDLLYPFLLSAYLSVGYTF